MGLLGSLTSQPSHVSKPEQWEDGWCLRLAPASIPHGDTWSHHVVPNTHTHTHTFTHTHARTPVVYHVQM